MKIIFLDIDGVLNTDRSIKNRVNNDQIDFEEEALINLMNVINQTDAYIVISSTWRIHKADNGFLWSELIRNLKSVNIEDRIIDITPVLDTNLRTQIRWQEIKKWLDDNKEKQISKFVIIDDEWSMEIYNDHFIKCYGYKGLTIELGDQAVRKLI